MKQKIINLLAKIKLFFNEIDVKRKLANANYDCAYIGTPYYGNLGDQQIRTSSLEFLKKHGRNVVEIDYRLYYRLKMHSFKNIKTIILQGGGNLGDVYLSDEFLRDDVVRCFKDKKIIIFPQTLYYQDKSKNGEMDTTINIFSKHPNLTIVARELISYEEMKKIFNKNKVILAPDIVLSSDYSKKYKFKRKSQVLFLVRNDIEKNISTEYLKYLEGFFKQKYKIIRDDTDKGYNVFDIARNCELNKIFKKIAKSKLVITDRLHGMIFCAITNTPCIVMSNYNHKIKSTYNDWLKNVGYIKYVDNINDINLNLIEDCMQSNDEWKDLTLEYCSIVEKIKEAL